MGECRYYKDCAIMKGQHDQAARSTLESISKRYCHADHAACARYLIATIFGRHQVPPDLRPSESHRALKLMRPSEESAD